MRDRERNREREYAFDGAKEVYRCCAGALNAVCARVPGTGGSV
jgi:hypothetical protein